MVGFVRRPVVEVIALVCPVSCRAGRHVIGARGRVDKVWTGQGRGPGPLDAPGGDRARAGSVACSRYRRGFRRGGVSRKGRRVAKRRVVIVGGGLAGAAAARELATGLVGAARDDVEIVQVSSVAAQVPRWLLASAVTGRVPIDVAATPMAGRMGLGGLGVRSVLAEVEAIEPARKAIVLAGEAVRRGSVAASMPYDELVACPEVEAEVGGVAGAPSRVFKLGDARDALALRARLLDVMAAASAEDSPRRRRSLCTVVVVGGGELAVQLAAEVAWALRAWSAAFARVEPGDGRVLLVAERVLSGMSSGLARRAAARLAAAGVEVVQGARVVEVADDHVMLARESSATERVDARVVAWLEGARLAPVYASLAGPGGGLLPVDDTLALTGAAGVWAAGDAAVGDDVGGVFDRAWASGALVGRNVAAKLSGGAARSLVAPSSVFVGCGPSGAVGELRGLAVPDAMCAALRAVRWLGRVPAGAVRSRVAWGLAMGALAPGGPPVAGEAALVTGASPALPVPAPLPLTPPPPATRATLPLPLPLAPPPSRPSSPR